MGVMRFLDLWDGAKECQKLLLVDEQGVGDKVRSAFFVAHLKDSIDEIYQVTDSRLAALFERSFKGVSVIVQDECPPQRAVIEYGIKTISSSVDLGQFYYQKLNDAANFDDLTVEKTKGYLIADKRKVSSWRSKLDRRHNVMNIGVCWRGPVEMPGRASWYATIEDLNKVFRGLAENINFVCLQYEPTELEIEAVHVAEYSSVLMPDLDLKDDFDGVASLVVNLDLVISPATALCELAGALGVPVWLFATKDRKKWNLDGGYMRGFYPNLSILFSNEPWNDVVRTMNNRLKELIEV